MIHNPITAVLPYSMKISNYLFCRKHTQYINRIVKLILKVKINFSGTAKSNTLTFEKRND